VARQPPRNSIESGRPKLLIGKASCDDHTLGREPIAVGQNEAERLARGFEADDQAWIEIGDRATLEP